MDIYRIDGIRSLFVPELYWRNPYNILKLPVCAAPRELRICREDIDAGLHCGEVDALFSKLRPDSRLLDQDEVEEYFDSLKQPLNRFFYWFFWFWPIGDARIDEEVKFLCGCAPTERRGALSGWYEYYQDDDTRGMIARHNFAVYFHLLALLHEQKRVEGLEFDPEVCDRSWKSAIKYWDKVADDDSFWEYLLDRVVQLDDPQITPHMVRNMRHDFPLGFDQINAELFKGCACSNDWDSAHRHISYINASQRGLDDVDATLGELVDAMFKRFEDYKHRIIGRVDDDPSSGLKVARAVAKAARKRLEVLSMISSIEGANFRSMSDDVAELMLKCQIAYAKLTDDWKPCVEVLELAREFAIGDSAKKRIEKNLSIVRDNADQDIIDALDDVVGDYILEAESAVEDDPMEGLDRATLIVNRLEELRARAEKAESEAFDFSADAYIDRLTEIVLACVVAYANKTKDLPPCIWPLEVAIEYATDKGVRDRILENLTAIRDDSARAEMSTYLSEERTYLGNSMSETKQHHERGLGLAKEILLRAETIVPRVREIARGASERAFGRTSEIAPNLMDEFALAALACLVEYSNETGEWVAVVDVLQRARDTAKGLPVKKRIETGIRTLKENLERAKVQDAMLIISNEIDERVSDARRNPKSGDMFAAQLVKALGDKVVELRRGGIGGVIDETEVKDAYVSAAIACLVEYANATEDWRGVAVKLDSLKTIGCSSKLAARIATNSEIVLANARKSELHGSCWICKAKLADHSFDQVVKMHGEITWEKDSQGNRSKMHWKAIDVHIPLCRQCSLSEDQRKADMEAESKRLANEVHDLRFGFHPFMGKQKKDERILLCDKRRAELAKLLTEVNQRNEFPEVQELKAKKYTFGPEPVATGHFSDGTPFGWV